jgi:hypothetical protein
MIQYICGAVRMAPVPVNTHKVLTISIIRNIRSMSFSFHAEFAPLTAEI